jgi:hypothetical protein
VFELRYDAWNAAGRQVAETKRISIDAGANFSRVESRYTSDRAGALPVAVGIAQRKGNGRLVRDTNASWMSYWEPESAPNGHTACAVIVPGQTTRAATDGTDALLVGTAQPGQPFVHYLGAGWSRSGDFPDAQAWETHVRNVVQRLAVPLRVTGPE